MLIYYSRRDSHSLPNEGNEKMIPFQVVKKGWRCCRSDDLWPDGIRRNSPGGVEDTMVVGDSWSGQEAPNPLIQARGRAPQVMLPKMVVCGFPVSCKFA